MKNSINPKYYFVPNGTDIIGSYLFLPLFSPIRDYPARDNILVENTLTFAIKSRQGRYTI